MLRRPRHAFRLVEREFCDPEHEEDEDDRSPHHVDVDPRCRQSIEHCLVEHWHPRRLTNRDELIGEAAAQLPPIFLLRRSEEHTSELQSLMRISYAVFCLQNTKICKLEE